jgi:hypothetical protein
MHVYHVYLLTFMTMHMFVCETWRLHQAHPNTRRFMHAKGSLVWFKTNSCHTYASWMHERADLKVCVCVLVWCERRVMHAYQHICTHAKRACVLKREGMSARKVCLWSSWIRRNLNVNACMNESLWLGWHVRNVYPCIHACMRVSVSVTSSLRMYISAHILCKLHVCACTTMHSGK